MDPTKHQRAFFFLNKKEVIHKFKIVQKRKEKENETTTKINYINFFNEAT